MSDVQRASVASLLAAGASPHPSDTPLANEPEPDAWHTVLRRSLLDLVADARSTWDETLRLDAGLEGGQPLEPGLAKRVDAGRALPLTPDWNTALRLGGGVLLAYLAAPDGDIARAGEDLLAAVRSDMATGTPSPRLLAAIDQALGIAQLRAADPRRQDRGTTSCRWRPMCPDGSPRCTCMTARSSSGERCCISWIASGSRTRRNAPTPRSGRRPRRWPRRDARIAATGR